MSSTDESGISDQALAIYMWFTFGVMIQLFNLFGIVTNIINIICFCRIAFEESVNVSLLALSVSDLLSLLTMTLTCIGFTPAMATVDLPFLIQEVVYVSSVLPHVCFTRISGCITALVTLERCLCITTPLKVKNLITPKRVAVVVISFFVVFLISDLPNISANRLGMKYVLSRNTTLLGIVGIPHRETIQTITFVINTFSIPLIAFVIILVCTTILAVQLQRNAKWRGKSISSSQNEKTTGRNYKVAKMVVMISTLFIVCFIPVSSFTLAVAFVPDLSVFGKYFRLTVLVAGLGNLMESVNSSVNIFFYLNMSSHYRNTFRRIFCLSKI